MLDLLKHHYTAIEPMSPRDRYPDVRVNTPSGRIAVEVTEVHWGVGRKGSPTRQREEAMIRAGGVAGLWPDPNPFPGIVRAVETKCDKHYTLDGDEDLWLLLVGGWSAAPGSTAIFPSNLDLVRLNGQTHDRLARSRFSRCYLFCELTPLGQAALYGWDRNSSWQEIVPVPAGPGPRAFPRFPAPVPRYID